MDQRELQCVAGDAKFEGMDTARLEHSVTSHRAMLTKFTNLANIMITTFQTNPSQRAAQELERLKQQIDWKVEDIEAGYNILLADLDTEDDEYIRLNAIGGQLVVTQTYQRKWSRPSELLQPYKTKLLHPQGQAATRSSSRKD